MRSVSSDKRAGRDVRVLIGALALVLILALMPRAALAETEPGTVIENRAAGTYADALVGSASVLSNTTSLTVEVQRTPSAVEFKFYSPPSPNAQLYSITEPEYLSGSVFQKLSAPVAPVSGSAIDLDEPVALVSTEAFMKGESVFLVVADQDQDLDFDALDSVLVTVSSSPEGDMEVIKLYETDIHSGVFAGYVPSVAYTASPSNATQQDGAIALAEGTTLTVSYVDVADATDVSDDLSYVDPFSLAFDAMSGTVLDGAVVTIVDAATGAPATVYGDDGVSAYPSSVTTGAATTDATGRTYSYGPGTYRFPFISNGTYRIEVAPPGGYVMPSTVADDLLQALPGAPYDISDASRGADFTVSESPVVQVDLPLDPQAEGLYVTKEASSATVETGDFLQYTITVAETLGRNDTGVEVQDYLPLGFRYREGSAKRDGEGIADPEVGEDGRSLVFAIGSLDADAEAAITFVVEVAAGAPEGKAVNHASASAEGGIYSNLAKVSVEVGTPFFTNINTIVGRVVADACGLPTPDAQGEGIAGVRIYLENGASVVTDEKGRFHFEAVATGTRVVQMDLDSLPPVYEPVLCAEDTGFARTAYSQFATLQGGTLYRADFHAKLRARAKGNVDVRLISGITDETVHYRIPVAVAGVAVANVRATLMLPEGVTYVAGSATLDGAPMADPTGFDDSTLTFRVGDAAAETTRVIEALARMPREGRPGTMESQAMATFDTPVGKDVRSGFVANTLVRTVREELVAHRKTLFFGNFVELSALLSEHQHTLLDSMIAELRGVPIDHVIVTGHTDDTPIPPENHKVFRNNYALSQARAQAVAAYLAQGLGIPARTFVVIGEGSDYPVAKNETEKERAMNRRVEVVAVAKSPVERYELRGVVMESAPSTTPALGLRPGEDDAAAAALPEDPDEFKPEAMPEFDETWLAGRDGSLELVWPPVGFNPHIPALSMAIKAGADEKVVLLNDEHQVNLVHFDRRIAAEGGAASLALWRAVPLKEGDTRFTFVALDRDGNERGRISRVVHYAGPPVSAKVVPELSRLVADGKTPPVIVVRLTDAYGYPARLDVAGEVSVSSPYAVKARTEALAGIPIADARSEAARFRIGKDGVARIALDPTTRTGEVTLTLSLSGGTKTVTAWLTPEDRDWILVAIAEGTLGYSVVDGNMESLSDSGADEDLYNEGRIAFFAKGRIKGSWLMTLAYDSGKESRLDTQIGDTIDPEDHYILYGDATTVQYEAESARKLYVKIEREKFYALFGDYETGLTATELGRYSRSLNGVKSEYRGGNFSFNAFASDTAQAFVKDEIPGDGTSGLYRLSEGSIVLNSEKVTIETRDRDRSEEIISSVEMTRHVDYDIDYDAGTLFFRSPVYSQDDDFNPIWIVVDYETTTGGDREYTYGGRAAVTAMDGAVEAGATVLHEEASGASGDLAALDAKVVLPSGFELRAEAAHTATTDGDGADASDRAWIVEASRTLGALTGKVYHREVGPDFGLGQQSADEVGTRKTGAEAAYDMPAWHTTVEALAYKKESLTDETEVSDAEAAATYQGTNYLLSGGFRVAEEIESDGETGEAAQVLMGASWTPPGTKITLRAAHEQSVFGIDTSDTYPTKTTVGADYPITEKVAVFADQELAQGDDEDTLTTRAGLKSTPWTGGAVSSTLARDVQNDATRVYQTLGLSQTWALNGRFSLDAGIDATDTISEDAADPDEETSGEDYLAANAGATYQTEGFAWRTRVEVRTSESQDKWGLYSGANGEPREGIGLAIGLKLFSTLDEDGSREKDATVQFGLAYRPLDTRWIVLDRLDLVYESDEEAGSEALDSWRAVNNLNLNFRPSLRTQASLLYGAKYVRDVFDEDDEYTGFTDLWSIEGRYSINPTWDVGARTLLLHSWSVGQLSYGYGLSVGYIAAKNLWIGGGYNFEGFTDSDFSAADFTAQGPFVRFRMKFDQVSARQAVRWLMGQ
jgi:uncharacterized repeat protein (TIGR01451 family)